MDRDALVGRCEDRFRDTGNAIYTASVWADYINDAYSDVLSASPWWPFLMARASNSVTSSGEVTLPTDAWRVTAVYNDTDNYVLQPIDGNSDYRYYFPDADANLGNPTHYRLRANVLEVYPRPAATITVVIDYTVAPAQLGASDEPVFPEQYHRMLISGAMAYAYEDDDNMQQAQTHRAKFEQYLERMKDDLLVSRSERYHGIVDDFGF